MRTKHVLALAGIAGSLLWASTAGAVTISIGLQQAGVNSGLITNEGSGTGAFAILNTPYGSFTSNTISGTGNPPLTSPTLLDSNSIDVSSSSAGTLKVYITSSGNTLPTGLLGFLSTFTANSLTPGWSVTEQTFLDAGNGIFALTTPLSSALFTTIGTSVANALANTGPGPYSVTEVFTIVSNGLGNANSTIDLSATPLPGALPLFASGLVGLWGWSRKRKAKKSGSLESATA